MKKLFLGSLLAVCALLMTSCLDGGSNERSGVGYGVIGYSETFKPVIKTGGVPFYAVEVANAFNKTEIEINDCCVFYYTLNSDIPENSSESLAANGYYTVSVTQYADIPKGYANSFVDDTATIIQNEMTTMSIDMSNTGILTDKNINMLFLSTIHENYFKDQKQELRLSYNRDQEPETVNGDKVYNLFLRVIKTEGDKSISSTQQLINAFDMNRFIQDFQYKEEQDSKKSLKYRINFANSFTKDSTQINWKASEVLTYTFPKEEE